MSLRLDVIRKSKDYFSEEKLKLEEWKIIR